MPLDPRTQQALSIAPGQQFSPWQGVPQLPGSGQPQGAAPLAPEDQSTEASRAEAQAKYQQALQQNQAAKAAEEAAQIADLQKRAKTDPAAARQLRMLGLE